MRSPISTATARACARWRAACFRPRSAWSTRRRRCARRFPTRRCWWSRRSTSGATTSPPRRNCRLMQKYGAGTARHRHRRLRRARHPRADHPPARQHRLRRAHARADAGAGAQAQPHDRPHQPGEARRGRPSLPAVRPPPHAELELGAHPRHPHAQRRDARHHRARRDRARDRDPRRRLRHAHPLFPAPAAAGGRGARARRDLRAARHAVGRGRLGGAAASRRALDPEPHRRARSSRA